jgi:hypothetical protein
VADAGQSAVNSREAATVGGAAARSAPAFVPKERRCGVGQKAEPLDAEARLALEQRQHRAADAGPGDRPDNQRAEQAVRPFALDPAEPDQPSVVVEADEGAAGFGEVGGRQLGGCQRAGQIIQRARRETRDAEAGHARAPRSYQPRDAFTIETTDSITGTSTSTPTTVASAAPE